MLWRPQASICVLASVLLLVMREAPAATLEEVGAFDLPSASFDTAVSGSLAVVVTEQGLRVIDVSDPEAPVELGAAPVALQNDSGDGYFVDAVLSGAHAYVTDGTAGLRIFDLSDPAHPAQTSVFDTEGLAQDVEVAGDVAYLAEAFSGYAPPESGGLDVVDVSDPALPAAVAFPRVPDGFAWLEARSLDVVGDRLYVAGEGRRIGEADAKVVVWILDVSQPATPVEVAIGDVSQYTAFGDLEAEGGIAYLSDQRLEDGVPPQPGVRVVEASGAAAPSSLAFVDTPALPSDIELGEGIAWVASDEGTPETPSPTLRLFDSTDPEAPSAAGTLDLGAPGSARLAVAGATGYATFGSGLLVVDASDPGAPVAKGSLTDVEDAVDVALVGQRAYVANEGMDLRILDVADPAAPFEVGFYDGDGRAARVAVAGGLAFLGGVDGSGVRIVDVSDPAAPAEVGSIPLYGSVARLAVSGNLLYVAERFESPDVSGLRIFDVSDPASPAPLGFLPTGSNPFVAPTDLSVEGDLVYLAAGSVRVVDVTDPESPTEIQTLASAGAVEVVGTRAFLLANTVSGYALVVLDVSDPAVPVELGATDLPLAAPVGPSWRPGALAVDGGYAVANVGSQVVLADVSDPAHPAVVDSRLVEAPTDRIPHATGIPNRVDGQAGLWALANHLAGVRLLTVPEPSGSLATVAAAGALALLGKRGRARDASA